LPVIVPVDATSGGRAVVVVEHAAQALATLHFAGHCPDFLSRFQQTIPETLVIPFVVIQRMITMPTKSRSRNDWYAIDGIRFI